MIDGIPKWWSPKKLPGFCFLSKVAVLCFCAATAATAALFAHFLAPLENLGYYNNLQYKSFAAMGSATNKRKVSPTKYEKNNGFKCQASIDHLSCRLCREVEWPVASRRRGVPMLFWWWNSQCVHHAFLSCYVCIYDGFMWFPKIGIPLVIIHFSGIFPYKPIVLGVCPINGTPYE